MKNRYDLLSNGDGLFLIDNELNKKEKIQYGGLNLINFINDQSEQIRSLEEKLVEQISKSELKEHMPAYCTLAGRDCEYMGKVKSLEEQLKNSITPKFKIGQEVFMVNSDYFYKRDYQVEKHLIVGIEDKIDRKNNYVRWYSLEYYDYKCNYSKRYKFLEKNIFATREDAEMRVACKSLYLLHKTGQTTCIW